MNTHQNYREPLPLASTLLAVALLATAPPLPAHGQPAAQAEAQITILVPADAEVFFDGEPTRPRGPERLFVTPPLDIGRKYRYDILARWRQGDRPVEQTRQVPVTGGARVRVDFLTPSDDKEDKEVMDSKATQRTSASSVNFSKQLNLPFASLGTLGSRIAAARRASDPVTLANAASELAVAESVSGQKASITSAALIKESAELARLRRQHAELQAVLKISNQIAGEEGWIKLMREEIATAKQRTLADTQSIRQNEEPTSAPRTLVVNNYTTQYVDINVNGFLKLQLGPGESQSCIIEHRWNPTVLTAYGNEDSMTWGPRYIWGRFKKYTWNIN
jgi:uncharacterized protein (TIGR03000 family)